MRPLIIVTACLLCAQLLPVPRANLPSERGDHRLLAEHQRDAAPVEPEYRAESRRLGRTELEWSRL